MRKKANLLLMIENQSKTNFDRIEIERIEMDKLLKLLDILNHDEDVIEITVFIKK